MAVTITISKISPNQWREVLSVAKWVIVALLCSAGLAYLDRGTKFLESVAPWLATPAAINLVAVVARQALTQEEGIAKSHLPRELLAAPQHPVL